MSYIDKMIEIIQSHSLSRVNPRIIQLSRMLPGFTGAATMDLLNKLVAEIPNDRYYLEIGTHRGKTLCGAAFENQNKNLIGVDNFIEGFGQENKSEIRYSLYENIVRFTRGVNVSIFPMDYKIFLDCMRSELKERVSVYFYDGDHSYFDQKKALEDIHDFLETRAIILIDDTFTKDRIDGARIETENVLKNDIRFRLIKDFEKKVETPSDVLGYWNGLMAIEYNKEGFHD